MASVKPVVALDIDGNLGDYHGHFLHFASEWYGRKMPNPAEINPGLPLHKFMRTSKATYRQCKLAYRQGGLERSMPVYDRADELCRSIRRAGAELWLCTTRPYLKYDTQQINTTHWLRRNHIQYDYLISGQNKYYDLIKQVGKDRVAAVMDDLPEMYIQAAKALGYQWPHRMQDGWPPILLRDQPYNRHLFSPIRVCDMEEALSEIDIMLDIWRKKNGQ